MEYSRCSTPHYTGGNKSVPPLIAFHVRVYSTYDGADNMKNVSLYTSSPPSFQQIASTQTHHVPPPTSKLTALNYLIHKHNNPHTRQCSNCRHDKSQDTVKSYASNSCTRRRYRDRRRRRRCLPSRAGIKFTANVIPNFIPRPSILLL